MSEDGLPPLREVIARHGLDARKGLGQNFLFDLNLTRRIARSAAPLSASTVVEIGPGPGGLTRALLLEGARKIVAVEKDTRALPALQEIAAHYPGRLEIVEADALRYDWTAHITGDAKIVANLPYNIATPLLTGWLTGPWPPWFSSLTLMFQKEVAERIVAAPGSEAYGRLSIISQWCASAKKLFDIDRRAFTPPPKITSSVVQLIPKSERLPACTISVLEKVTAAAFGQRRKMLRSSLKSLHPDMSKLLDGLGIDANLRAEQLAVADFARIAASLESDPV
ncbi:16S rRNA (adenine(1518)-N(6)/adenine(1519)-N(6))-dimethyltransferase RsmA [Nordella sp. HKS 07]|uniref:16S rRNA (adenine(1518)-N(6)/adenine(1519)-N(6))- dimethyltransferase RsmA n=1 Tax=Nordella sp. HKS 07 TaxID=2712222 RepID=UPI0013E12388|nr:16S rRNA (adenine(1518)-N(6)/adenine(1519)-N(6))-dimethyltransferase RsmA [Nordella sp. HKS 07]QIG50689.1 16S rRNA (adenine(1518)-N(6)/adenine(1519)-N(6))-dimethyltransferase RsmA [Nordella sp. HKS 07]